MKVRVKRQMKQTHQALIQTLGPNVVYVDVPTTVAGIMMKGVYTDKSKTEVSVMWPIDRPHEGQQQLASKICMEVYPPDSDEVRLGAWPADHMEREVKRGLLSLIGGDQ